MIPRFLYRFLHPVCLAGIVVFIVGFGASCVGLLGDFFESEPHPYQGLLTFVLYPSVTFAGVGIVVLGLLLERRRLRRLELAHQEWAPALDFKNRRHRLIIAGLGLFTVAFVLSSVMGAYRAYRFTESETFCGALCHTPMEPQYVAHMDSPHARVPCTECHVGPGIGGYVKAKVSGLRQLWQVLTDSYHGPIHAPNDKIPGASATCLHCHSSRQFPGKRFDGKTRFGYDLRNSRRYLEVVLDVGGAGTSERAAEGIHWHANPDNAVYFRAADQKRQEIPWVRVVRADGTESVYRALPPEPDDPAEPGGSSGGPPPPSHDPDEATSGPVDVDALPELRMDCLDCHNRPAHRFQTAEAAVDQALASGRVDTSLPSIKKLMVRVLSRPERDREAGLAAIGEEIEAYYRDHFDGSVLARREAIAGAVETARAIYRRNAFPEMGIDGYTYPDNNSHRFTPGCFRCHDGRHVSDDGKVLDKDCALCHELYERSRDAESLTRLPPDLRTVHPFRDPAHLKKLRCWDCHTGRESPYTRCASCHERAKVSHGMQFECSICHVPNEDKPGPTRCASCHPVGDSPLHATPAHADCTRCHQPHDWAVERQHACLPCHQDDDKAPTDESWRAGFGHVGKHMMGLPIGPKKPPPR